jgi:hypothetical protein
MQAQVLSLVYCRNGGRTPPPNKPVLCLFRRNMGTYFASDFKICTYVVLPSEAGLIHKWVEHNTIGIVEVVPFAWVETTEFTAEPEFYTTLAQLGQVKINLTW